MKKRIPQDLKNVYHFIKAVLANIIFLFPSRNLRVIGVTGTDGKTTTVSMIGHILKGLNVKTGVITTVAAEIEGGKIETGDHVTNPGPFKLQSLLRKMVDQKCKTAVIEVTSHGIDQHRIFGISFDIGVLTNISSEHIDYHRTTEIYRNTKLRFLKRCRSRIINLDDSSYKHASKVLKKNVKIYSISSPDVDLFIDIKDSSKGKLVVNTKDKVIEINSPLRQGFNIQNIAAALLAVKSMGYNLELAVKALESFELPEGRLQRVENDKGIEIIIDYAHTANAVKEVISEYSKSNKKGRVIVLVSAEGERDAQKRVDIPQVALKYSDLVILNPIDTRSEDPEDILSQMSKAAEEAGAKEFKSKSKNSEKNTKYYKPLVDRRKAISFAVKSARKGDIVLILGKGHEKSINVGGRDFHWSDKKAVIEALKNKKDKLTSERA